MNDSLTDQSCHRHTATILIRICHVEDYVLKGFNIVCIRLAIEKASFDIKQKLPLKVTVSIGAYLKRPDGRYSMAESLKFADSALYKAKEGGRNQVVEYLETEPEKGVILEEAHQ